MIQTTISKPIDLDPNKYKNKAKAAELISQIQSAESKRIDFNTQLSHYKKAVQNIEYKLMLYRKQIAEYRKALQDLKR